MIHIHEKTAPADIERIAALAAEIWREHYTDMIGAGQVEYMLENFQSAEAITRQIENEGYRYFVAEEDGDFLGYGALQMSADSNRLFLSKFYVRKSARGRGIGRQLLRYAVSCFDVKPAMTVWLTVHKGNVASLAAYEKLGFTLAGDFVIDIGNGYVMDDYRLECPAETILQSGKESISSSRQTVRSKHG